MTLDELTFGRFPQWHLVPRQGRACRGTQSEYAWVFERGRLARGESSRRIACAAFGSREGNTHGNTEHGGQLLGFLRFEHARV